MLNAVWLKLLEKNRITPTMLATRIRVVYATESPDASENDIGTTVANKLREFSIGHSGNDTMTIRVYVQGLATIYISNPSVNKTELKVTFRKDKEEVTDSVFFNIKEHTSHELSELSKDALRVIQNKLLDKNGLIKHVPDLDNGKQPLQPSKVSIRQKEWKQLVNKFIKTMEHLDLSESSLRLTNDNFLTMKTLVRNAMILGYKELELTQIVEGEEVARSITSLD